MATLDLVSPIDGHVVLSESTASHEEIERAVQSADSARKSWRSTPLGERIALVERLVDWFVDHADEIGREITVQMGRPIRYSPNEIRRGFAERARYMASVAPRALANVEVPPIEGFQRFIAREPVGVVFVIAPWNYPYLTSVNTIVPALLAGNTVIMKHAAQTLSVGQRYVQGWEAVGGPAGVLQNLVLTHEDVANVIADSRIGYAAFTGSVEGGHAISRAASERFIGTGLELGGKDPAYVRHDADVAYAVAETVDGSFFNSGQSCCGIERIYVHADVYDEFVEGFVTTTRTYQLGDPLKEETTLGPMVSGRAAENVRAQITDAVAKGARVAVSEHEFAASEVGTPYLGPTVLLDVDHSMAVMTDESFGPVVGIMKVRSDEEAVELMNDSAYGLTASVWTSDVEAALRIGSDLETGTVFMNRCDYLDPALAWTGVKDTGAGITLSEMGFGALTRAKSFHVKVLS